MRSILSVTTFVAFTFVTSSAAPHARAAPTMSKGAYTAAQAARGVATFNTNCAICHGQDLAGGSGAPALSGPEFMFTWKAKTAADLYAYVKGAMPPSAVGSLSDRQYADVVAVILRANGHVAGKSELTSDPAAQKGIVIGRP